MSVEKEFWSRIQKERKCEGCLFFDPTRKGEGRFCTYAFRLNIEQRESGEVCNTRKERKQERYARITPQNYNQGDNIHFIESKTEFWVFGILKKQLVELGVSILKIKNFNGDWGFLMSIEDAQKVSKKYPNPYKKEIK